MRTPEECMVRLEELFQEIIDVMNEVEALRDSEEGEALEAAIEKDPTMKARADALMKKFDHIRKS
jgi:hypothetical protein